MAVYMALIPNYIGPDVQPMPETVFFNPTLGVVNREKEKFVDVWESCLTIPRKMYVE